MIHFASVFSGVFGSRLRGLFLLLCLPFVATAENKIELTENFYKLTFNEESGVYTKEEVEAVKPGDLVELDIKATNIGGNVARNVELVNTVPTGSARMVEGSLTVDEQLAEVRLSRNGDTYFPAAVEIPAEDIRYVKWVIYELEPAASLSLSYRLRVSGGQPTTPAVEEKPQPVPTPAPEVEEEASEEEPPAASDSEEEVILPPLPPAE